MQQSNIRCPYVIADIGGTNSRFALVTKVDREKNTYTIENQLTFPSADFLTLEDAFLNYCNTLNGEKITNACLAVAGPVEGKMIELTNLDWKFSIHHTKEKLGLSSLKIINDFAAYAYAIQYIDKSCLKLIKDGNEIKGSPIAVMGPGTGFGVASLISCENRVSALALEGGHMSLAANTPLQSAVKDKLSDTFSTVTIENVLSGPGISYLYHALAAVEGKTPQDISTAKICQYALDGSDDLCLNTLTLFCSWLGSVAGDLALVLGARGGIYLGGGILPRIADFLVNSEFQETFVKKGQMSNYLEEIPIQLVTEGNSALLGAAAWMMDYGE